MISFRYHRLVDPNWRKLCRSLLRRYGGQLQWDRARKAIMYVSPKMKRYRLPPVDHENSLMLAVRMLRRSGFAV